MFEETEEKRTCEILKTIRSVEFNVWTRLFVVESG